MENSEAIEEIFIKINNMKMILWMNSNELIAKEYKCKKCYVFLKMIGANRCIDQYALRCFNTKTPKCCKYSMLESFYFHRIQSYI